MAVLLSSNAVSRVGNGNKANAALLGMSIVIAPCFCGKNVLASVVLYGGDESRVVNSGIFNAWCNNVVRSGGPLDDARPANIELTIAMEEEVMACTETE